MRGNPAQKWTICIVFRYEYFSHIIVAMTNLNPRDPDLSHVSSSDFSYVYEPGDDTFLLMSALDDTLHPPSSSTNKAGIILEIG